MTPPERVVNALPLSTVERGLAWEVRLSAADGLPRPCVLEPEWTRSIDRSRIGPRIASLPDARWPDVEDALLDALGFDH